MNRVLIPFTDPESAERAVRQLLDEAPSAKFEVELLAVVEPLTPGKVRIYLSAQRAEELARAAAQRWLARIESLLDGAHIAHRSEVAMGRPAAMIDAALRRGDIDRVLLPARSPRWRSAAAAGRQSARLTRAAHHPVTLVP
jgi:nucleotide-binding universal stress UspA family protein